MIRVFAIRKLAIIAFWALLTQSSDVAVAQTLTDSLTTTVSRVQGRGLYVRHSGVAWIRGDTLTLVSELKGEGRVRVAGKASGTLLLAWLSSPLTLEVEEEVMLIGPRRIAPDVSEAEQGDDDRESILAGETSVAVTTAKRPVRVSGMFNSSLSATYSDLSGRFTSNRSASRTYATPVSSLRMRIEGLPGQTQLRFNVRGSRRFSSEDIVGQAGSVKLYEMKIMRQPSSSRLSVEAGRFRERHTAAGGYLDGASASFDIGKGSIGVAGGFEPERYNQSFQTDMHKLVAFADWNTRHPGGTTSLSTSFMRIDGGTLPSPFSLVSVEQKSRFNDLRISTSLQLDHAPIQNSWKLSRLYVRASTPISPSLSVNGRYGKRQYFTYWLPNGRYSSEKEQVSVGFQLSRSPHFVSVNLSSNSFSGSERSNSVSASIRTRPRWLPFAFSNTSNVWKRANNTTFYNASSFQREIKGVTFGLEYSLLAVDMVGPLSLSHIAGVSARVSFEKWGYLSIRERTHIGSSLTSSTLYLNYGIGF